MVDAVDGCFSAAGPGRFVKVKGNMNATKYKEILDENLLQSAGKLQLGKRFIIQQFQTSNQSFTRIA